MLGVSGTGNARVFIQGFFPAEIYPAEGKARADTSKPPFFIGDRHFFNALLCLTSANFYLLWWLEV